MWVTVDIFWEASSVQEKVLVNIRLPRVVLAALVGASLALSVLRFRVCFESAG